MAGKEIQFRKKREIGDVFSDSFAFLKQEFKPISKLVGIYVLPFVLLYAFLQIYVQNKVFGKIDITDTEKILANIGPVYLNLLITSLFGLFVQSLLAGTYYTYIDFYVKKGKGNFELHEITPLLFSNSLLALGANLVLFVIVVMGVIMCILPGIYFANTFSVVLMIVIFEKNGIGNALIRSWNLVNSQWWNTLLINIVGIFMIWIVSLFFSIPYMLSGFISTFQGIQKTGIPVYPEWHWILMGISSVVSSLLVIIVYTFLAFQYFNLDYLLPNNDHAV